MEQLPRFVRLGFPAAFFRLSKLQKFRTHTNSRLIQCIADCGRVGIGYNSAVTACILNRTS